MLVTHPVIVAISNGSLPKMIHNLDLDGCSRHEWSARIVTDLVRLYTLRCTCTPPTCVCLCQNLVVSATDKKKIVVCVCECRAHTQSVSITGIPEEILNQTTHDPIDDVLTMFRQVAGLSRPPRPPPPLVATLQGTFDSTHTHTHTT